MSGRQRQARKRRWDWDQDPPSQGPSETSSQPWSRLDLPVPDASVDSASSSSSSSSSSEVEEPEEWDSESCSDDSTTSSHALGNDEGHAGPLPLSTIRGCFSGEVLNFRLPCTATENTTCQIVGHLSVWNEFLFPACWQLQEMPGTSGRLSLVLFRHPTSSFRPSEQLDQVIGLVCHLLKTHRCVVHVEFDLFLLEQCDLTPLSDALQGRESITRVKLTFRGSTSGKGLVEAAFRLPRLQELECSALGCPSQALIDSLSSLLRNTSSLKMLRLSDFINFGGSSSKILRALAENHSSLTELVLPGCIIARAAEDAQNAFTWWLKKSVSLKSVTVLGELTSLERNPLNGILLGLLENESITAVDIHRPRLHQADVRVLTEIIRQNGVLQSLKISHGTSAYKRPCFKEGGPNRDDSERCLKALVENSSLVEVALPIDVWNEHQWKKLFTALPGMTNLKRVSIELPDWTSINVPGSLADKLCTALRQTGAGEMSFNAPLTIRAFDERLQCEAFSSVVVEASDDDGKAVCEVLERMPTLGHITCLELHFLFEVNLGTQLVSALANFLQATRTLKTLSLSFSSLDQLVDCQEALMESLAVNRSLREVRIEVDEDRIDSSVFYRTMAVVINGSRNISRLHLTLKNDDFDGDGYDEDDDDEDDYVEGIAENYTLLDLTVSDSMFTLGRRWFKITDTTRRNQGLLTCAADFVTDARQDRRCAAALERMQRHPELVEQVARMKGVDQERAAKMVQDKLRSIQRADMHQF